MIDLQALHGIGPKRAQRIVKYREEVSHILSIHDLATATGMSLKQAGSLSQLVRWEKPKPSFSALVMPFMIFSGSFMLILYGLGEIQLEHTSATQFIYNVSLLMIMIGCISLVLEQLIFYVSGQHFVSRPITVISMTAFILGVVCLLSLVGITILLEQPPDLTARMMATTNFLIFVFLILYLISAPSIHLKRNNLYTEIRLENIESAASLFDYGHILLASLVFIMLTLFNSGSGIEEIFAIWASVLLASSGMEMTRGRSAYVSLLSAHEQETLEFIRNTDDGTNSSVMISAMKAPATKSLNLRKFTGVILIGIAVLLSCLAFYQLV